MTKAHKEPTLRQAICASAFVTLFYGMAASFGVLAGLSLAGLEYRRFDLMQKKPGWTQEDEDARKEKDACRFSAIGAAIGISLALVLGPPQVGLGPKMRLPHAPFSRHLATGISFACFFTGFFNEMNRSERMMDIRSRLLSREEKQPPRSQ